MKEEVSTTTKQKYTIEKTDYARLNAPIPEEYLETYTEDGIEFTGYKAQYAINLLNIVYGLGKWYAEFKLEKVERINNAWLSYGVVKIYVDGKIVADGIGGSFAKRIENSLKGSKTSAFKNACRYLGIGNELYLAGHDEDVVYEKVEASVSLPDEAVANVPNDIKTTADLINNATNINQLEVLLPEISNTSGKAVKDLLIKLYNNKKLELNV